jgi:hypothetical protein
MATRDDFDDACKAACGCAQGAAALRKVWDTANKDATQTIKFSELLADSLVSLAYQLKRSRSVFPLVAQEIRALRKKRPKPVAGIRAESYHDQAIKLADDTVWKASTALWLGREILGVVDGPDIPKVQLQQSLTNRRESVVVKIRRVLSDPNWREGPRLSRGLRHFNGDALIVSINKETALAIRTRATAPWFHSPDEQRPEQFCYGPLTGTAGELDAATCQRKEPDRNHRQLKGRGINGHFWIVKRRRTCLEVWFRDQASYTAAARRLGRS